MTGRRTDPGVIGRALSFQCPKCRANPGMGCSAETHMKVRVRVRLHQSRLDMARSALVTEKRAALAKAFGRIGDAV